MLIAMLTAAVLALPLLALPLALGEPDCQPCDMNTYAGQF